MLNIEHSQSGIQTFVTLVELLPRAFTRLG